MAVWRIWQYISGNILLPRHADWDRLTIPESSRGSWCKYLLTISLARYAITLILNWTETENNIFSTSVIKRQQSFTCSYSTQLSQKKHL